MHRGLFRFSIDRETDPHGEFTVDNNGLVMTTRRHGVVMTTVVMTTRHLDRESQPSHRVHVLAVDKGGLVIIIIIIIIINVLCLLWSLLEVSKQVNLDTVITAPKSQQVTQSRRMTFVVA